jgi:hypothetical protein
MEALRIVFAILSGALVRGSVLASVDDSSDGSVRERGRGRDRPLSSTTSRSATQAATAIAERESLAPGQRAAGADLHAVGPLRQHEPELRDAARERRGDIPDSAPRARRSHGYSRLAVARAPIPVRGRA